MENPGRNAVPALDVAALTRFFAARARDLPWRHAEAGPWGVLVSEVMLQQTPVARVLPIYDEWLGRWPTPASLAAAGPGDAVRAWGRLGYPRRALRLHEAAGAITRDHAGAVPQDLAALLALPGVGQYTARAVAAFAFGQRQPVVDTNVRRVLSRAIRGTDDGGAATAADRALLLELLPSDSAAAVETCAALMELGALVCTAAKPHCSSCPLAPTCAWRARGYPAGPSRSRQPQRWLGTDRKMRGEIMAALRSASAPLTRAQLAARTASYAGNETQWERCLASLIADGLAKLTRAGLIALP